MSDYNPYESTQYPDDAPADDGYTASESLTDGDNESTVDHEYPQHGAQYPQDEYSDRLDGYTTQQDVSGEVAYYEDPPDGGLRLENPYDPQYTDPSHQQLSQGINEYSQIQQETYQRTDYAEYRDEGAEPAKGSHDGHIGSGSSSAVHAALKNSSSTSHSAPKGPTTTARESPPSHPSGAAKVPSSASPGAPKLSSSSSSGVPRASSLAAHVAPKFSSLSASVPSGPRGSQSPSGAPKARPVRPVSAFSIQSSYSQTVTSTTENYRYGIDYTLSTVSRPPEFTIETLEQRGIRFIRLQWVDLINVVRFRVVPIAHFKRMLATARPSVSITKISLGLVSMTAVPGFSAVGEYLYVVDRSSFRLCRYAAGHASVMGWFEEKVPLPGLNGLPTLKVDICPRTVLRRVVENAKVTTGMDFLVGFETEFILLKSTDPIEAVNSHGWSVSAALSAGSTEAAVLEDISAALNDSGVEVLMYSSKAAPGQFEVVTGPLPPLQAADALIHTRETIYNIASKHGLRATLAPQVYLNNRGSTAHTHISIHGPNKLSASRVLNIDEAFFLASLLEHLPALSVITRPLEASYKCMLDSVWSGGSYVCWGIENCEAPIRLCNASAPLSRNFELRTIDGTSNPYFVLAGVLGVGTLGIKEKRKLELRHIRGDRGAAMLNEAERRALGIKDRMPLSLEEARKRLVSDNIVKGLFGDVFVGKYLATNKTLATAMLGNGEKTDLIRLVENY